MLIIIEVMRRDLMSMHLGQSPMLCLLIAGSFRSCVHKSAAAASMA